MTIFLGLIDTKLPLLNQETFYKRKAQSVSCPLPLGSSAHMQAFLQTKKMGVVARQDDVLTLVHPGRRIEIFHEPIRAGELMRKYPRHCIARPDVFEFPWIALHPQSLLPRGCVFFLVPYHTIHALLKNRRQQQKKLSPHCLNYNKHNYPRNHVSDYHRESCETGNLYKLIGRFMKRNINQHQTEDISCYYQTEWPVDCSSRRPRVSSEELIELLRIKPCLRKPDSDRKNLNLRVTFSNSLVFSSIRSGFLSDPQGDQTLQV